MALDFLDPALVATIERTQLLAQSDEQFTARAILLPLWDAALRTGDQASACVIAHDLSHAQETPSAALDWHRRALAAADAAAYDAADDRLRNFYPSLHANVAEAALRGGALSTARQHAAAAQATAHLLGADGYGRMIHVLIARLVAATTPGRSA
jgi:hypothetical protein